MIVDMLCYFLGVLVIIARFLGGLWMKNQTTASLVPCDVIDLVFGRARSWAGPDGDTIVSSA